MRIMITLTLGILLLAGRTVGAADWPAFRGVHGTAVSSETGLPTTWDVKTGDNVRWKAEVPGRGVSGAVVARSRVYVTSCSGYRQDRLHVLAFDAHSGKQLWERQLLATGSSNCHPKTSMAGATPVTDGERVYALFGTGDVACFDADGTLVWYRSLVRDYPTITNQVGMAASPVLWKNLLFVPMENSGDQSFLLALDTRTGENRWKADRAREINWTTPLIVPRADGADVVMQSPGEMTAFDAESGSKRWEHRGKGLATIASPFPGAGGVIFASGGDTAALKPDAGTGSAASLWTTPKLRTGYTTPLYYNGYVYGLMSTFLNVVDEKGNSGGALRLNVKGGFSASPVLADGKIYAIAEDGTSFVIKPGKEPELLATNRLGETVLATPAIAEGALFVRTDTSLWCLGKKP